MIAIPSVDLHDGAMVGPAQIPAKGRARDSHFEVARNLVDLGFRHLHVVEAGAASGVPAVEEIVRDTNATVQVGGVVSTSEIEHLLRAGVDHVVVGARALDEPEWLADIADLYPGAIAVATDVRDRRVVRRGWVRTLPVDILDVVDELNALPLRELLVTVRPVDGAAGIADLALLEDVADRSRFPVSVVGGVSSVSDLRALEHRGIAGAVIDAGRLLGGTLDGQRVAQEFGA
jgi:phosphoribosylformimino-5-aminoimidazole carboxamide ribotide isomerase